MDEKAVNTFGSGYRNEKFFVSRGHQVLLPPGYILFNMFLFISDSNLTVPVVLRKPITPFVLLPGRSMVTIICLFTTRWAHWTPVDLPT